MDYLKKNILTLIAISILIIFGILFIVINPVLLINIVMYSIAILMIMIAINFFIQSQHYLGDDKTKLIVQSIILIIFAVLLFVFPEYLLRLIIGSILILVPLIELILATDKLAQLKKDIWKYIVGIIFVLSFGIILKIVFVSLGTAILALAGYIIYLLIVHKKDNQNIFVIIFLKKIIRKEDNDIWHL